MIAIAGIAIPAETEAGSIYSEVYVNKVDLKARCILLLTQCRTKENKAMISQLGNALSSDLRSEAIEIDEQCNTTVKTRYVCWK